MERGREGSDFGFILIDGDVFQGGGREEARTEIWESFIVCGQGCSERRNATNSLRKPQACACQGALREWKDEGVLFCPSGGPCISLHHLVYGPGLGCRHRPSGGLLYQQILLDPHGPPHALVSGSGCFGAAGGGTSGVFTLWSFHLACLRVKGE